MKIIKKKFLEIKKEIVYDNDFIDDVILNYDKRMIIIFCYIVYQFQKDSKIIEIDKKKLKKVFKTERLSDAKLSKYIRSILKTTIYYRSSKNIFEDGKIFANKNDYVEEPIFERLSFSVGENTIKFLLKERYKNMFLNIKEKFSKHSIEDLENMSKISILIFLQLKRWKNWKQKVYMNFEYFKLNVNLSEGYRQMDIIRKLEKSIKEIKENTGLEVSYGLIRSPNKRKIEQLVFSIDNSKERYQQTLFDINAEPVKKKIARWVLKKQYGEEYEEEE